MEHVYDEITNVQATEKEKMKEIGKYLEKREHWLFLQHRMLPRRRNLHQPTQLLQLCWATVMIVTKAETVTQTLDFWVVSSCTS